MNDALQRRMNLRSLTCFLGLAWCLACSSPSTDREASVDGGDGERTEGSGGASNVDGHAGAAGIDASVTGQGGAAGMGGSAGAGGALDEGHDASNEKRNDDKIDSAVSSGDGGICSTCGNNEVCVERQTVGGAIRRPDDAGRCSDGFVIVSEAPTMCSPAPSFQCMPLPSTCNTNPAAAAVAHCVCASSFCVASTCTDLTPTHMRCLQMVP